MRVCVPPCLFACVCDAVDDGARVVVASDANTSWLSPTSDSTAAAVTAACDQPLCALLCRIRSTRRVLWDGTRAAESDAGTGSAYHHCQQPPASVVVEVSPLPTAAGGAVSAAAAYEYMDARRAALQSGLQSALGSNSATVQVVR